MFREHRKFYGAQCKYSAASVTCIDGQFRVPFGELVELPSQAFDRPFVSDIESISDVYLRSAKGLIGM
jgi:hypothetical protein